MSDDLRQVWELVAARKTRDPNGGGLSYELTLHAAGGPDKDAPVKVLAPPGALRSWDRLDLWARTAGLGPFVAIRPAHPARLRLDKSDPNLRGLLPEPWQGDPQADADQSTFPSAGTAAPTGGAVFGRQPDAVGVSLGRRRELLAGSVLGRATLKRGGG